MPGGNEGQEICYYVQSSAQSIQTEDLEKLRWILGGGELGMRKLAPVSRHNGNVLEIGPKKGMIPVDSSNLTKALQEAGLNIDMVRMSRRLPIIGQNNNHAYDHMLEEQYSHPLTTFDSGIMPAATYSIPVLAEGRVALENLSKKLGLGLDRYQLDFLVKLTALLGRDPTILEVMGVAQMTSEHCSHGFFNAQLVFDHIEQSQTLFEMVKEPLKILREDGDERCIIAFCDNAAAIEIDGETLMLQSDYPGQPSAYLHRCINALLCLKVETHNHPSMIKPGPGVATGVGGCIRDILAVGRGGIPTGIRLSIFAGRLNLPDYDMPGEKLQNGEAAWKYSDRYASGLDQFTEGKSEGAHFGNASGIPTLSYRCYSFGLTVDGKRREFIKPVVAAGLLGVMSKKHAKKHVQGWGMLVVALGGPAFRVGLNGGAGSSATKGSAQADQDQASVQRGNPIVQRGVYEVVKTCIEMGEKNPILCAHDQGAGGQSVVGFEIGDTGVRYHLSNTMIGDPTMSQVEIYCCEYQERIYVLITPDDLELLEGICDREGVNLEVAGEITGDGRIVVIDERDESMPVDLPIEPIKNASGFRTYTDNTIAKNLTTFILPSIPIAEMVEQVLKLMSVGSVRHGLDEMDSWVGGRTVVNQRVGPLQLSVSQFAVLATSQISDSGHVSAEASQPAAMLVDEAKAARLTLATALGNIAFVEIQGGLSAIYGSVNWCWDAKQPGEAIRMHSAMESLVEGIMDMKTATPHCGKDSLSLGVEIDNERIKSPGVLLITLHGVATNIRNVVTADIKYAGMSLIGWINLSGGKFRLGGSALAHACGTVGNDCPDVDTELYARGLAAMQDLVAARLIWAGHNPAENGLLISLLKMAAAGNCGIDVDIQGDIATLFAHEAGFVIEFDPSDEQHISDVLERHGMKGVLAVIGKTTKADSESENIIRVRYGKHRHDCQDENEMFEEKTWTVCKWYEATSDQINRRQFPAAIAEEKANDPYRFVTPIMRLDYTPTVAPRNRQGWRPKVAIIRAIGSNGQEEMAEICFKAGMEPINLPMHDIMSGKYDLHRCFGVFFVGGFADGDAGGSAVGLAARWKFNQRAKKELADFIARPSTFINGECNGCQLGTLLGLVPGEDFVKKHGIDGAIAMGHNLSGRFEARVGTVRIEQNTNSIMLTGMEGSILPVIVAHAEGRFMFADDKALQAIEDAGLVAMRYCLPNGELANGKYPHNPNGSPNDIAALTDMSGRRMFAMPHPERMLRREVMPLIHPDWSHLVETPWLRMFENAAEWAKGMRNVQ